MPSPSRCVDNSRSSRDRTASGSCSGRTDPSRLAPRRAPSISLRFGLCTRDWGGFLRLFRPALVLSAVGCLLALNLVGAQAAAPARASLLRKDVTPGLQHANRQGAIDPR